MAVSLRIMLTGLVLLSLTSAALATPVTSGLQLWLDGSDPDGDGVVEGVGENGTSGATVTWADKSGNARNFTQSTAARQPVYSATGFSNSTGAYDFTGNPAVDANADMLTRIGANSAPLATGDDNYTYVIVWNADQHNQFRYVYTQGPPVPNQRGALILSDTTHGFNGLNNDANGFVTSVTGQTRLTFLQVENSGVMFNGTSVAYGTPAEANVRIINNGGATTTYRARTNGAGPAGLNIQSGETYIGSADSTGFAFDGKIAEIMVYDRVLQQSEMDTVGNYLKTKYNQRWNQVSPTLIMDNRDNGYSFTAGFGNVVVNPTSVIEGDWDNSNTIGSTATYTPPAALVSDAFGTADGYRFVQVHYMAHQNQTPTATYTVNHALGSTNVVVNQERLADQVTAAGGANLGSGWFTLGRFLNPTSVTLSGTAGVLNETSTDAIRIGAGKNIDDILASRTGSGWAAATGADYANEDTRETTSFFASNQANAVATYSNLVNYAGNYQVSVSWNALNLHTIGAQYLVDLDGNTGTTGDQTIFSGIDMRNNAAGTPVGTARQWSGFYTLGTLALNPSSIIVLSNPGHTGGNPWLIADNLLTTAEPPEVAVSGNAVNISDGDATPSLLDYTDFGATTVGTPITRVFRVDNLGTEELVTSLLAVPAGYSIIEGLSQTILTGSFDTFTVQLDALLAGTYSGDITFTNNDPDEGSFNFAITGEVQAEAVPEPSTYALALVGLAGLGLLATRRRV